MGLESVDKGEFEVGETVKVAYVDQQHKDIDPNKTVYQVISGGNDLIRMGKPRCECPCIPERASISPVLTRKNFVVCFLVVNVTVCIWPWH